jgi:ADP-ribose pyrophosphatase YjhB (NUDIX family)
MAHYCYKCGEALQRAVFSGDNRLREKCPNCGYLHYENPKVQVAVVVNYEDKILWIKRANDPRKGFWELPGGFMEVDESLREASARETLEETGVIIKQNSLELYMVGTVGFINEVHVLFRAQAEIATLKPGLEAEEACWLDEERAPWQSIAYPQTEIALRFFYRDIRENSFGVYYAEQNIDSLHLRDYLRVQDTMD